MKFIATSFLATALFVGQAAAHSRVFQHHIGGVAQGDGVAIRRPPTNSPIKDLASADLRCNVGGSTAVAGKVTVAAGGVIQPEWFHDTQGDDIIDGSHVGPIITYLAPLASNGDGDVWVKIVEEGFSGGVWAVTNLKNNKGIHSVTIPATLAPGEYLMRNEIIALHEADALHSQNAARGAQFYPSCSQITVTGSGAVTLPAGVPFPGAYTDSTPGVLFNVYGSFSTYPIPGPAVWDGTTGGSAPAPVSSSAAPAPTSTSVAAPVPTTTSVAAPVPTTSVAAPVPTTTSVAAPVPTTSSAAAPVPTTSSIAAPVPTTSVAAPVPTSSVAAPVPTTSSVAAPAPTISSAVAPAPAPTGGVVDANVCWRTYNKCLDASQPRPDFSGCSATRDQCMINARYMRLRRSGTLGRLF